MNRQFNYKNHFYKVEALKIKKLNHVLTLSALIPLVIALHGCQPIGSKTPTGLSGQTSAMDVHSKIDLVQLLEKYRKTKFYIQYDFEVKKEKTYVGVKTKTIFTDLVKRFKIDTSRYHVAFFCKDGYSPMVPLAQLLADNGYIAVKDFDAPGDWEEAMQEKFSPAYLVWDLAVDDHRHSFPYGIVSVQFVEKKTAYRLATPKNGDVKVMEGFSLFKDKCIKCHAINTAGGVMGPELNFPKSVTEYWKTDQLKLFIKNPADFRQNSKMPSLELNDQQIDLIVEYLEFMAAQKTAKEE